MLNAEMNRKSPERSILGFEEIAYKNKDIRLTTHPDSPQVITDFCSLQDPLLNGSDIPSLQLLLQLPFYEQTHIIQNFLMSLQRRKDKNLSRTTYDDRIAHPDTEAYLEKHSSLFSRPFSVVSHDKVGKEVHSVFALQNEASHSNSLLQLKFTSVFDTTQGIEITSIYLQKPNGEKLLLTYPEQRIFVHEGNPCSIASSATKEVFLKTYPITFRDIAIWGHEANHIISYNPDDFDHHIGLMKLDQLQKQYHDEDGKIDAQLTRGILEKNYGEYFIVLTEPLTIGEAASIYENEINASTGAHADMERIIGFLGPEFSSLLEEADLLYADALSTYFVSLSRFVGKSLLPEEYAQLTPEGLQKLAETKQLLKQSA